MTGYCEHETLERARAGDLTAVHELYTVNQPLIWKIARKFAHFDNAVSLDDLLQEGFFAIVDAVQTYDEERGSWQQVLAWELKHRYNQVLPMRRRKAKLVSLDAPAGEDDDSALMDCLADGGPGIDAGLMLEDFKTTVHRLVKERTDAQMHQILMAHDIGGEPLGEVAERMELSYQAMCTKRRMALRQLARYPDLRELYRDSYEIETVTYGRSAEEAAVLVMGNTTTY